jgi:hypothetical protein
MKKVFDTAKLERRLQFARNVSVLLIILAVIMLFFHDFSQFDSFRSIGSILDSVLFFGVGIALYITTSKTINKISGSYIQFEDSVFSFKSRQVEQQIEVPEGLRKLEIRLKTIELLNAGGKKFIIYLDDYSDYTDKTAIKEHFKRLKP